MTDLEKYIEHLKNMLNEYIQESEVARASVIDSFSKDIDQAEEFNRKLKANDIFDGLPKLSEKEINFLNVPSKMIGTGDEFRQVTKDNYKELIEEANEREKFYRNYEYHK